MDLLVFTSMHQRFAPDCNAQSGSVAPAVPFKPISLQLGAISIPSGRLRARQAHLQLPICAIPHRINHPDDTCLCAIYQFHIEKRLPVHQGHMIPMPQAVFPWLACAALLTLKPDCPCTDECTFLVAVAEQH